MPTHRSLSWLIPLLYVLLAGLTVAGRIAFLLHDRTYDRFEKDEMERAAVCLAKEGFLGHIYSDSSGVSAHVAPVYPMFLAGLYRVFGWDTLAGNLAQEIAVIAATTLGICLLPGLARRAGLSPAAGWLAGFALAVTPIYLWVETGGGWEQPFAALALMGLFCLACTLSEERWRDRRALVLTGVLLGVLALLTPALLPAAALIICAELAAGQCYRKRVVAGSLIMIPLAGLIVLPWIIRNYYEMSGFVPLRSNFGLELAIGNNDDADGRTFGNFDPSHAFRKLHPFHNPAEKARLQDMGELAFMRDKQQTALKWIREHPARTATLTAHRFQMFWFPTADVWPESSPLRGPRAGLLMLIAIGAMLGLVQLTLGRHPKAWLLAAVMIGPSLIYMVTHVDMRYRYPVSWITTLLAMNWVCVATGVAWQACRGIGQPSSQGSLRSGAGPVLSGSTLHDLSQ